jgi:hypothetical protein
MSLAPLNTCFEEYYFLGCDAKQAGVGWWNAYFFQNVRELLPDFMASHPKR